jgi:hypothetical protein
VFDLAFSLFERNVKGILGTNSNLLLNADAASPNGMMHLVPGMGELWIPGA